MRLWGCHFTRLSPGGCLVIGGGAPVQESTSTQSTSVDLSGDVSDPSGEPDILEPPSAQPAAGEYRATLTF